MKYDKRTSKTEVSEMCTIKDMMSGDMHGRQPQKWVGHNDTQSLGADVVFFVGVPFLPMGK
jgi:hypothetical protein